MLITSLKNLPAGVRQKELNTQCGAICYRVVRGKPEILLITSRGTGRWIVPKGWPIDGLGPAKSAAQEAWEEAGVVGKLKDSCIGIYGYMKIVEDGKDLPCAVMLYPIRVKSLQADFPEKDQRRRKWFTPKKAAARVDEPDLAAVLRNFDPTKVA